MRQVVVGRKEDKLRPTIADPNPTLVEAQPINTIDDIGSGNGIAKRFVLPTIGLPIALILMADTATSCGLISLSVATVLTVGFVALASSIAMAGIAQRIDVLEKGLYDLTFNDELTGICNLRGLLKRGTQALLETNRLGLTLTVLYFDLDGLKAINDQYGHKVGSRFIVEMTQLLKHTFRASDIIARIGGDEFAVVIHGTPFDSSAALLRLFEAASNRNQGSSHPYRLEYCVGRAWSTGHVDDTVMDIVGRADTEMYKTKKLKHQLATVSGAQSLATQPEQKRYTAADAIEETNPQ